ncbi:unnamed protein product [Camellia sinensis]
MKESHLLCQTNSNTFAPSISTPRIRTHIFYISLYFLDSFSRKSSLSIPDSFCYCMAVRFLGREVSDLCLGKPALSTIPFSATVADALSALKRSGESYVSVWNCDHSSAAARKTDCRCVGKVCMVDAICFLCRVTNLLSPSLALQSPISDLLPEVPGPVRHLESHSSLLDPRLEWNGSLESTQNLAIVANRCLIRNAKSRTLEEMTLTSHGRW